MTATLRSAVAAPSKGSPISTDLILAWTGLTLVWLVPHWKTLALVTVPLMISVLFPRTRWCPWPWLLTFVACVPFMIVGWARLEDHVYLILYWVLAVGLVLHDERGAAGSGGISERGAAQRRGAAAGISERGAAQRRGAAAGSGGISERGAAQRRGAAAGTSERGAAARMAWHARVLVGLSFAAAVAWKVTSLAYLRGDVFRTVLVSDHRFDVFSRLVGGASQAEIDANRRAFAGLARPGAALTDVPLIAGPRFGLLVFTLVAWTLLVEAAIAMSMLAPDRSAAARWRHPALLAFCLSTYPFVPVVGFAFMFTVAGLVLTDDRRIQGLYVGTAALALFGVVT